MQSQQRIEQLKEEFKGTESIGLETRWKDVLTLVEEKKSSKPLYEEATQIEILTAFEETIKDMEREDQ